MSTVVNAIDEQIDGLRSVSKKVLDEITFLKDDGSRGNSERIKCLKLLWMKVMIEILSLRALRFRFTQSLSRIR